MNQQPYDNSIKAIFQEDATEIVPQFLPGALFVDVLDTEILRSALRADRVYQIYYKDVPYILHLEFQASSDKKMPQRLLAYYAGLRLNYSQPIISMVVYLFHKNTPKPPLKEFNGTKEVLTFYYQVLELWNLDASQYLKEHTICMYTMLPMMKNVDVNMLTQALKELIEYYKDDEAKLARRLLWFRTFLERADTLSPQDKQKVEENLDIFDQILEESSFVRKQRALAEAQGLEKGLEKGLERGLEKGLEKGEVQSSQQILLEILQTRYPALAEELQSRIERTIQANKLHEAIKRIVNIFDEQQTRDVLNTFLVS